MLFFRHFILIIIIAASCDFSHGQVLINKGAQLVVKPNTHVLLNEGGLVNNNNGRIINNGVLHVEQDLTQSGVTTKYLGNGWLVFDGASNQNISGVDSVLKLNLNNGNQLVLGTDLTVVDSLKLNNNGRISIGNNVLALASGAKITDYGPNGYVITGGSGSLKRPVTSIDGSVVFPVGRNSYNLATISNAGTSDSFAARVEDQVVEEGTSGNPVTNDVVDRTWHIAEATPGGSDVTLRLQWLNTEELTAFDRASCGIAHYNSSLSAWEDPATTVSATNEGSGYWSAVKSGVNSFSPFAVEDDLLVLPIELLSFSATKKGKAVDIEWITSTEIENDYFEIERSKNGEDFSPILRQKGAGTSSRQIVYSDIDPEPLNGWSYYRLKQVDFDGRTSYSQLESIFFQTTQKETHISIFPNPNMGQFQLKLPDLNKPFNIEVVDLLGKTVHKQNSNGGELAEIQIKDAAAGVYLVKVEGEGFYDIQKVVVR